MPALRGWGATGKTFPVIPAKAGIQTAFAISSSAFLWARPWIPACAGMTVVSEGLAVGAAGIGARQPTGMTMVSEDLAVLESTLFD